MDDYVLPTDLAYKVCIKFNNYQTSLGFQQKMHSRQHTIHHDKWFPLKKNWIRLNNDIVVKGIMKAGCVGLMRDNNGVWCEDFSKKIGTYGLRIVEFMKD